MSPLTQGLNYRSACDIAYTWMERRGVVNPMNYSISSHCAAVKSTRLGSQIVHGLAALPALASVD